MIMVFHMHNAHKSLKLRNFQNFIGEFHLHILNIIIAEVNF